MVLKNLPVEFKSAPWLPLLEYGVIKLQNPAAIKFLLQHVGSPSKKPATSMLIIILQATFYLPFAGFILITVIFSRYLKTKYHIPLIY